MGDPFSGGDPLGTDLQDTTSVDRNPFLYQDPGMVWNPSAKRWEYPASSKPSGGGGGGGGLPGLGEAASKAVPAATGTTATGAGGALATAGKVLPWLQWAYGVYNSQRDGKYQNVPQSPQQAELYNWARGKVDALPDVNKALYPTAISHATASPSLDMDKLRAGTPGAYTAPQQTAEGKLAGVLAGQPPPPGANAAPAEILKWYYSTFGQPGVAPGAPPTGGG